MPAAKKRAKTARRKPGRPKDTERAEIEALKTRWIEAYPEVGWRTACEQTGVSLSTPSHWKASDKSFAERFEAVQPAIADRLERILDDIAEGKQEVFNSAPVTAAIFRLKGLRPLVYRENVRTEVSGPNGGPIEVKGDATRALDLAASWIGGARGG